MEHGTVKRQKKASGRWPLQAELQPKTAESGQTTLEFALMLPFMMLLLLGIAEIGRAAFISITVSNAATAGVEYGSQNAATASDITGMQNAAKNDANYSPMTFSTNSTGTQTPTYGCLCDNGNGASCNASSSPWSACSTISCTGQIVECVQVDTHADFTSLFNYPGLPQSFHANGNAVERVRK